MWSLFFSCTDFTPYKGSSLSGREDLGKRGGEGCKRNNPHSRVSRPSEGQRLSVSAHEKILCIDWNGAGGEGRGVKRSRRVVDFLVQVPVTGSYVPRRTKLETTD